MSKSVRFEFLPASIGAARRFVARCLDGMPGDLRQRAELMTSELATNAIRHAGTGFTVAVQVSEHRVRVEVSDEGHGSPRRRDVGPLDTSGRGLNIVAALSDRWGVSEHASGSMVWFDVRR